MMSFDLAGEGKATDAEIQCAADNIFNELRILIVLKMQDQLLR